MIDKLFGSKGYKQNLLLKTRSLSRISLSLNFGNLQAHRSSLVHSWACMQHGWHSKHFSLAQCSTGAWCTAWTIIISSMSWVVCVLWLESGDTAHSTDAQPPWWWWHFLFFPVSSSTFAYWNNQHGYRRKYPNNLDSSGRAPLAHEPRCDWCVWLYHCNYFPRHTYIVYGDISKFWASATDFLVVVPVNACCLTCL